MIEEIQRGCLDQQVSVESLLRKVKFAAAKLNLEDLEEWVSAELNGYGDGDLPTYRKLKGMGLAKVPYSGWVPVADTQIPSINDFFTSKSLYCSIAEVSSILENTSGVSVDFPFDTGLAMKLGEVAGVTCTHVVIRVSRASLNEICEVVRNRILDWALQMEKSGVKGEDLTFNATEVDNANSAMTTFIINNNGQMAGNIGNGNTAGSISIDGTNIVKLKEVMTQLRDNADALVNDGADEKLPEMIDAVLQEADKPKPEPGALKHLFEVVKGAISNAGGSLIATGALTMLNDFALLAGWV
ncbi:hypothetical protein HGG70_05275 [Rhodobacteraceae bacterium R_SAG4]|nr:hypothetical protein [Rhodobacteraceae bacterium R_SAG4]